MTKQNDYAEMTLRQLAMKYHWLEIAPNVYRDKFGNNVRRDEFANGCYTVTGLYEMKTFANLKALDEMYSKPTEYCKLCDDLAYLDIPYTLVRNHEVTPFTPIGFISVHNLNTHIVSLVHETLEKYQKYFYFRTAISSSGDLNIWVYTTKKQYFDHARHLLNNRKVKPN